MIPVLGLNTGAVTALVIPLCRPIRRYYFWGTSLLGSTVLYLFFAEKQSQYVVKEEVVKVSPAQRASSKNTILS
jgi:hypothetical protein